MLRKSLRDSPSFSGLTRHDTLMVSIGLPLTPTQLASAPEPRRSDRECQGQSGFSGYLGGVDGVELDVFLRDHRRLCDVLLDLFERRRRRRKTRKGEANDEGRRARTEKTKETPTRAQVHHGTSA